MFHYIIFKQGIQIIFQIQTSGFITNISTQTINKITGIENTSVTSVMGDMYQNINIYGNNILVFNKQFTAQVESAIHIFPLKHNSCGRFDLKRI